jgi:hypothetical protein
MIKPVTYSGADRLNVLITDTDMIRPYSQVLKRIVSSVWKLLLINALVLAMVLYTLMFTDAQRHEDFYLSPAIFNGLIIYFILFPAIKALMHLVSLYICKARLNLYKMQMAEVISEPDYVRYIKQPLRKIQILFMVYPVVILTHAVIVFICYYLKEHFMHF